MATLDESRYRHLLDETFTKIDAAFEDVDPDVAESVNAQGTLTVLFADGRRLILSPQAPVRQIWVAFKDRAWHMDYQVEAGRWVDDRGEGLELFALIEDLVRGACGLAVRIARD